MYSLKSRHLASLRLPPPEQKFNAVIGRTYKDSKPGKIEVVKAPAGAPNLLLILIDDSPSLNNLQDFAPQRKRATIYDPKLAEKMRLATIPCIQVVPALPEVAMMMSSGRF